MTGTGGEPPGAAGTAGRRIGYAPGDGRRIDVLLDAGEVGRKAEGFYPDYRAEAGTGEPDLSLRRSGGTYRIEGGGRRETAEDPGLALSLYELALTNLLAGGIEEAIRLHGGGIRGKGGALLISGPPEAGKSTLTVASGLRGYPLYGDDIVLLHRPSGEIRPFRRLLKVTDPALGLLGLPRCHGPGGELWPDRSLLHPDDLGTRWAEPAPIATVVFPLRGSGREPGLREVGPGDAVRRLLRQTLYAGEVEPADFRALAEAVADARFLELGVDDLDEAAAVVEELLGR